MKRLIVMLLVLSFSFAASAQKLIWRADEILLPGGKIDSLMSDTSFTDATDTDVPTAAAVKAYVGNNAGGGNPIDSTTTRNDSIFINVGGQEFFSGFDLYQTIATDADTANVAFKFPSMLVRSDATNNLFEWTGTKWVAAGRSYTVATAADLSDLPQRTGWAYVSGEDAWYYWDGSAWVENVVAPSDLAQEGATLGQVPRWDGSQYTPQTINAPELVDSSVVYTVCSDGSCDFTTLGQAFTFVSPLLTRLDTLQESSIGIKIVRNADNSPNIFPDQTIIRGGDYSRIVLFSDSTTHYCESGFIRFENCQPPTMKNLYIRGLNTNTFGITVINSGGFVQIDECRIDSFRLQFYGINFGSVRIDDTQMNNGRGSNATNVWLENGDWYSTDCNFSHAQSGSFRAIRNCRVQLARDTLYNNLGYVFRGLDGFINLLYVRMQDSLFSKATVDVDDNIAIVSIDDLSGITVEDFRQGILGSDGICVINNRTGISSTEFMEASTAAEPDANSGIRYYFNTDEQKTKVSVNDQWEYLDTPDTLIVHLPVLEYTGDANDTIPNLFDKYLTAHAAGWGNRKVVALEVTTPDTTSVDLHFWLYEYDAVDNTNSLFLPDPGASESYFTLPAGQTNRRFQLGDNFFPGSTINVEDSKMLDFRLLNGNGSPGIDDLVGEGPNGIYLTIYLTQ